MVDRRVRNLIKKDIFLFFVIGVKCIEEILVVELVNECVIIIGF